MAYSIQRAVSDGTLVLLDISIDYLDRSEITVYFDGVLSTTGWAWVGSTDKRINFSPAVPNGVEVTLKRSTNLSELRHTFTLGAAFTAESLDEDLQQVLHVVQESRENFAGITDVYSNLNMHGYSVVSLRPAASAGEAVEYSQFQTAITATVSEAAAAASAFAANAEAYATSANAAAASAAGYSTIAAGNASAANSSANSAAVSSAVSLSAAELAQGAAGLAANYAQLANISDYGLVTGGISATGDYGSI